MLTGVPLHEFELLESGWWVWRSPGTPVSQVPAGLRQEASEYKGNYNQRGNGGCVIC